MAIVQIPSPGFEDRLIRTYSDAGYYIKQVETGVIYEAADDVPGKYTYIETLTPIAHRETVERVQPQQDAEDDEDINLDSLDVAMEALVTAEYAACILKILTED